ncbi:hypothetical protein CW304_26365 [Bacillus sp. UFRGS-B20]|nr:hypothetical protein CW304_26365 [Bacillus sp. UFRGS-B20]
MYSLVISSQACDFQHLLDFLYTFMCPGCCFYLPSGSRFVFLYLRAEFSAKSLGIPFRLRTSAAFQH